MSAAFKKIGVATETKPLTATPLTQLPLSMGSSADAPVKPATTPQVFGNKPSTAITAYLPIKETDVEQIGQDLAKDIGATTEKIVNRMTVNKFGGLGDILTTVQGQANKLSPAAMKRGGVLGWWDNNFGDIKKRFTMQFNSAGEVFDKLEVKIAEHVTAHSEWVKDLESLYTENFERYNRIVKVIQQGEAWIQASEQSLKAWPNVDPADPEAPMKIQAKRDAESLLNRLRIKVDNFSRLKTLTENNAPKIRGQQEVSRTTISTLRVVVEQTIPMLRVEFALFLQSLDSKETIELIKSAQTLSNKTLTTAADTAKIAAVESAKAANTPIVATDTLEYIRNKMLDTMQEVKSIETAATQQREADAKLIKEGQARFLQQLQGNNAI